MGESWGSQWPDLAGDGEQKREEQHQPHHCVGAQLAVETKSQQRLKAVYRALVSSVESMQV